jgi:DNA-binding response OmpR family regulator
MMISVLVVEDNADLLDEMLFQLRYAGFSASGVNCAHEMDTALSKGMPDVLILDLGLPDEDGLSVAQRLKLEHPRLGIIVVTARVNVDDRLMGYRVGADYYLAKPINFQELNLLVPRLVRRLQPNSASPNLSVPKLILDRLRQRVYLHLNQTDVSSSLSLTWMEVRLLEVFLGSNQLMASKSDLILAIGGDVSEFSDLRRLEVAMSRLRKKLEKWLLNHEQQPEGSDIIKVKRNFGYQLTRGVFAYDEQIPDVV